MEEHEKLFNNAIQTIKDERDRLHGEISSLKDALEIKTSFIEEISRKYEQLKSNYDLLNERWKKVDSLFDAIKTDN